MKKSRAEILSINPAFTRFILGLQVNYKPTLYKEGEGIILDVENENTIILTKELADNLNKEQLESYEKNRDKNPFETLEALNFIESSLIASSKENGQDYLHDISDLLEKLRQELNETHLMVLGDWNTPWLYQENDYMPVKQALLYLEKNIEKEFNGGFMLKEQEIYDFIPHLFWLTRCNASLPYFYMTFPKSKTFISFCKYGVLHFEFHNEDEKAKIIDNLSSMKFKKLNNCSDLITLDDFDGRKIKISN